MWIGELHQYNQHNHISHNHYRFGNERYKFNNQYVNGDYHLDDISNVY